jgi:hypothetical protein
LLAGFPAIIQARQQVIQQVIQQASHQADMLSGLTAG